MALAEAMLSDRYNDETHTVVDHYTYAIASDGDLMEGVSHEAFSLAGHLGLNKLVIFYDSNRITIEGETDLAYSDDVKRRFQGYKWNVVETDGHDYDQIDKAIRKAKREKSRPTIVICESHIGLGSPNKVDTAGVHGEPLGEEELLAAKQNLGLPADQPFHVPDRVREIFEARAKSAKRKANKWARQFKAFREARPDLAAAWDAAHNLELPDDLESRLPEFDPEAAIATRSAGGKVIQKLAEAVPYLVGGSADLAPSTKTLIDASEDVAPGTFTGRNFHFGIREHGMAGIMSGMALHGGFRVFGATFFVFLDYCRPSVRLAALMKLPVIYVFTHDSVFVGEDGPTHQPIEHMAIMRATPGLTEFRPADATETAAAWVATLHHTQGPVAMVLTRQNLPVIDRQACAPASMVAKGAYTLWQSGEGTPDLILMASGSEVSIALEAAQQLGASRNVRVVSMPSWALFDEQDTSYRDAVLPPECRRRVAVEAAASFGWERYLGDEGKAICIDRFGASAPHKVIAEQFGMTVENIVSVASQDH
jgi:transketolase